MINKKYKNIKTEKKGIRYYSSILYPKIPESPDDIYIISKKSDRLDVLASKYYNDSRYWKIIALANELGNGSFNVDAGIQLRIPMNLESVSTLFLEIV